MLVQRARIRFGGGDGGRGLGEGVEGTGGLGWGGSRYLSHGGFAQKDELDAATRLGRRGLLRVGHSVIGLWVRRGRG